MTFVIYKHKNYEPHHPSLCWLQWTSNYSNYFINEGALRAPTQKFPFQEQRIFETVTCHRNLLSHYILHYLKVHLWVVTGQQWWISLSAMNIIIIMYNTYYKYIHLSSLPPSLPLSHVYMYIHVQIPFIYITEYTCTKHCNSLHLIVTTTHSPYTLSTCTPHMSHACHMHTTCS